ncbi:MAG: nucleoside kinase [Bacteroidetes bacterium]|nr:nucleoside kinase [Bacteroidota bacterium]
MINIICENNSSKKKYKFGTSLNEIAKDQNIKIEHPILGAIVNNKLKELSYRIYKPKNVKFIDITHPQGMRMYVRSLSFVLEKAVKELYPHANLFIKHSVSKGYYCEIENLNTELTNEIIFEIGNRMRDIVKKDRPFTREEILTKEAIDLFEKNNFTEKSKLFKNRYQLYTSIYSLDDAIDYYYGFLVPSTGCLKIFDLVKYYEGMLLMIPKIKTPEELEDIVLQNKMFDIFKEYKDWGKILGVGTVGSINEMVLNGNANELIKISEALHEKKVAQIADRIFNQKGEIKLILISGPSSSGKTTFAKRLAVQLKVIGLKPRTLSLDNYFVNRKLTPKDENGEYDFEALEALDIQLFNKNIIDLFNGKEVDMPKFSFETGERFYDGSKLKINNKNIIIAEGIHALNPKLIPLIDNKNTIKVYVSALTSTSLDGHNRIPTTDNRLIRRIVRDYRYRHYSALDTIKRWESVRNGENKNIFPYQENADVMFNTALVYELGVLKKFVEPMLKEVMPDKPEFDEASRLLKFFSYFTPISDEEIPPTSIIREFLGGSSFNYK